MYVNICHSPCLDMKGIQAYYSNTHVSIKKTFLKNHNIADIKAGIQKF